MSELLFKHKEISFYSDNRWVSESVADEDQSLNRSLRVREHGAWCVADGRIKLIGSGGMPIKPVPTEIQDSYQLYIARLITEAISEALSDE